MTARLAQTLEMPCDIDSGGEGAYEVDGKGVPLQEDGKYEDDT